MINELKQICNDIVGSWFSEEDETELIFYLNDELLRESKIIMNFNEQKGIENIYGVAVLPTLDENNNYVYYIDIGRINKLYYKIISINSDTLRLQKFFMNLDETTIGPIINLKRKVNMKFAEEMLKGIN